jgi:hypothetical protein
MARVGEAVIRGIIRNIVSTCHDEEYHISQNLAGALVGSKPWQHFFPLSITFMQIKAAVIHPDNGFAADKTLSEKDIDNIVEVFQSSLNQQALGLNQSFRFAAITFEVRALVYNFSACKRSLQLSTEVEVRALYHSW